MKLGLLPGYRPCGQIFTNASGVRVRYQQFIKMNNTTRRRLIKINVFAVLIKGCWGILLLLELRTVLIRRLQQVQNFHIWSCLFATSRTCTMDSAFDIGYSHLYRTCNTLWNVERSSRFLEVASCLVWKLIGRDIQNVSKEHHVLKGFIYKWNFWEWQS